MVPRKLPTEDEVLDAHEKYIDERFGKDASVNIGWAVDEVEMTYSSKVYGHGVVTTDMVTLESSFTEFD